MRNQTRALQSLANHLWGVEEALEQEAVLAECRSALDARRSQPAAGSGDEVGAACNVTARRRERATGILDE